MAGRDAPQRTCVGCRARAEKSDLLRVVAIENVCVPDPRSRLPGRGAHLHPDLACLDLAERRRAFPRALRRAGPLDTEAVREHLESRHGSAGPNRARNQQQQAEPRAHRRVGSGSRRG